MPRLVQLPTGDWVDPELVTAIQMRLPTLNVSGMYDVVIHIGEVDYLVYHHESKDETIANRDSIGKFLAALDQPSEDDLSSPEGFSADDIDRIDWEKYGKEFLKKHMGDQR